MSDTSHGTLRLHAIRTGALSRDPIELPTATCARPRGFRARLKAARRQWIERHGGAAASLAVWRSRQAWLDDVAAWVYSAEGRAACAQWHIRPEVVLRVAAVLAGYADGTTGRNCAPTNSTVAAEAGCCSSVVGRIRNKLLAPAGLAYEAVRGVGGGGRPNRASIWHLIPRQAAAQSAAISDLPTSRRESGLSHLGINSPSASAGTSTRKTPQRPGPKTPRPLAVQRLAAGLVARSVGLGRVHPGQICDALSRSHLDLEQWDARQLAAALNADMQATGLHWPDSIRRPAAFLAARLRRLPAAPENTTRVVSEARARKEPITVHKPAGAAVREAALGKMRAAVAAARSTHRLTHPGLFQTPHPATR